MKIIINNKETVSLIPNVVTNKFIKDTDNVWEYNLGEYDDVSEYSVLLTEDNEVKGCIFIEQVESPKDVFLSTVKNEYLNLDGAVQLKIDCVDIPQSWTSKDSMNEIFAMWQHHLRTYFEEQRVIVWFEVDKFYMCPIATNVSESEYKNFALYMSDLFIGLLLKEIHSPSKE